MPVLVLRSLTLTKEESALLRVALAALAETTVLTRTSGWQHKASLLSDEGREVLAELTRKAEEVDAKFPAEKPQKLDVTYLIPFAGNRMVSRTSGPIHIVKTEEINGTRAQCGLLVQTSRNSYSQRTRLKAGEETNVHDACLAAVHGG